MEEQRTPVFAIVAFVGAVLVLLGGAVVASRPSKSATTPMPAADDYPPLPSLAVVQRGQPLQLAGRRPKPALLHLWATWCGPCRAELPLILDYGRSGAVDVIALSVDDEFASVQQYFNNDIPSEVAWDQKIVVEPAMRVNSLPTTFLIDTEGRVRERYTGMRDWSDAAFRTEVASKLR